MKTVKVDGGWGWNGADMLLYKNNTILNEKLNKRIPQYCKEYNDTH
jgi:hypothetical protein